MEKTRLTMDRGMQVENTCNGLGTSEKHSPIGVK